MNDQENKLLLSIYQFGKRQRLFELIRYITLFICIIIVLWLSVSFADIFLYFSTITRWGLWFIHALIIGYLLIKFIINPWLNFQILRPKSDLSQICLSISNKYPEIKNTLSNAYNLITKNQQEPISKDLHSAAIKKYLDKFESYRFTERITLNNYLPSPKFIIPIFLSTIILLSFKTENIFHSSLRLLNPTNEYLILPKFTFDVQPGNTKIIKGGSVDFKIKYSGPVLSRCHITIHSQTDQEQQRIPLKESNGYYIATLSNINKNLTYQIHGKSLLDKSLENRIYSNQFNIDILTPPIINNLNISLTPPNYSQLETEYLARNIGDILGLVGTYVNFKATVNKGLNLAIIQFSDGKTINGTIQGHRVSAGFRIKKNGSYRIILQDTSGLNNLNPIDYTISILQDNPPFVEINQPGEDIEIQLDATLAIQAEIVDDYGVSEASLYFKYLRSSGSSTDTAWHRTLLPLNSNQKRQNLTHSWDFNKLPVAFDDGIAYFVRAIDNNNVSGPGLGRSKTYYIRFPSLEELFDTFTEKEEEQITKMDDVAKQSEQLKKELEKINRKLKRADKIEWEQKQQIENTLDKQKQLQNKIREIQKELEDLISHLEANELISPELLEKYSQLQELFQEIATPELYEAINNLQQSLDKADPKQVQQALQNFKLNQEEFQKKIERTMELLKQVQLEQKMDQLVQKATKLMEQQEKITKQLQNEKSMDNENSEQVINQQKQQEKLLDNMKNDLKEFLTEPKLSNFQGTLEHIKSAQEIAEKIQEENQMQKLQENVNQQKQSAALNMSRNLQNQLVQMRTSVSKAQSSMLNQNKKDIQEKMLSATKKLLQLSHNQEQVLKNTETTSPLNDNFAEISVKQNRTQQNFQKLVSDLIQLSKKTFFIKPGISKSLGKSQISMAKSIEELSERNKSQAMRQQTYALEGLNESVMQMQQSLSQLEQSQSATGFEQFMEQLQQMANSQGQLNDQALNLFQVQGNKGALSMQQQRQMQRMAGQQAALREALENMSNEMGSRQDIMGRLGDLSGKMDEVVQDLLKQNISRETINRQREILSRMLDAQKSVREREFSKKRKAEIAQNYKVIDPGELKNLSDLQQKKLQEALKKSLNEGYNSDYQNLIELYFKQLIQQQNEKN